MTGMTGPVIPLESPAPTARRMWTLFEAVHVMTYFGPQARAAYEVAGLRGFWRGYFAGRAAPVGAVGAPVVISTFFSFAPAFVRRAVPAVWELITPAGALREHRGDGHIAALVAADIGGCEALVLRSAVDEAGVARAQLQAVRGWTDEEWDAAAGRLGGRGWLDGAGAATAAGRAAHRAVEAATDAAAARPWARLGAGRTAELAELLAPVARACATALPYPNPVGVPEPTAG
jgi:hypothetical protein